MTQDAPQTLNDAPNLALEYYLRRNDPLDPVYEVDTAAQTYRMVASRIGVVASVGGSMPDGGARFRSDDFERVYPKRVQGNVITFTPDVP